MGYGDLWGYNLIVLIFYKSSLGFMDEPRVIWGFIVINGWAFSDINPHKSQDWIYKKSILSNYIPINPHKP